MKRDSCRKKSLEGGKAGRKGGRDPFVHAYALLCCFLSVAGGERRIVRTAYHAQPNGEKPNHATRDQERGRGEHHVPTGEGHGVLEVVRGEQRLVEEDDAHGAEYRRQHPDGNLHAEACHLGGRPRRAHDVMMYSFFFVFSAAVAVAVAGVVPFLSFFFGFFWFFSRSRPT